MQEKLLYHQTKRLPEILSENEINTILTKIYNSDDYWKKGNYKEWGDFFKMRDLCLIATIYFLGHSDLYIVA